MEVKVEWELNDVERVVVEVLEPFGFEVVYMMDGGFWVEYGDLGLFVQVEGSMVKLYRRYVSDKLVVCLCDPGSLGVIEGWVRGFWVVGGELGLWGVGLVQPLDL